LQNTAVLARPNVKTVLFLDTDGKPIAFMATRMMVVDTNGASSAQRAGNSQLGDKRDGMSTGFLLARMGVHSDHQGQGVGTSVVKEAMSAAVRAYEEAPFQLFVVDAENVSLIAYYQKLGLRLLANSERLLTPMKQVIKGLQAT